MFAFFVICLLVSITLYFAKKIIRGVLVELVALFFRLPGYFMHIVMDGKEKTNTE